MRCESWVLPALIECLFREIIYHETLSLCSIRVFLGRESYMASDCISNVALKNGKKHQHKNALDYIALTKRKASHKLTI